MEGNLKIELYLLEVNDAAEVIVTRISSLYDYRCTNTVFTQTVRTPQLITILVLNPFSLADQNIPVQCRSR